MIDVVAAEHELAEFLENTKNNQLQTWNRQRSFGELRSLVLRRLDLLDEVEL